MTPTAEAPNYINTTNPQCSHQPWPNLGDPPLWCDGCDHWYATRKRQDGALVVEAWKGEVDEEDMPNVDQRTLWSVLAAPDAGKHTEPTPESERLAQPHSGGDTIEDVASVVEGDGSEEAPDVEDGNADEGEDEDERG